MSVEVSKTSKREIIHGALFQIFPNLVLFPVLSGFEPATFCVLSGDGTSVLPEQRLEPRKSLGICISWQLQEPFLLRSMYATLLDKSIHLQM